MARRLLFVTSTRIGDAVLSTGLLGHLIEEMEGPAVTVACGPLAAPLFAGVPGLEQVITMPKRKRGKHWWDLWRRTAGTRWDTVVDLRRSALAYVLPFVRRRWVLKRVADDIHRVEANASVLGLSQTPPMPRLWTLPRHEDRAAALMGSGSDPILAVGPTANWRAKTWRAAHFADLIGRLTGPGGPLTGARVAVFGGPGEEEQARPVLDAIPEARRLNLVGGEDLLTVYACLKRCALYVGNDSALMHLAATAGIPTLGLFGPSREDHFGPWGRRASYLRTATPYAELVPPGVDLRDADSLMDSLTVDMAEDAARRRLEAA